MSNASVEEMGMGVIENRVEGPQQVITTHISQKDYLNQWGNNRDQYGWVLEEINKQLPPGKIKEAMDSALEERRARIKANLGDLSPIQTESAKNFAFRGIKRNSKGEYWEHPEATISQVEANLHEYGIDSPNLTSATHILQGHIWGMYAFPDPLDLEKDDSDVSEILIYESGSYVLPTKPGDTTATLIDDRTVKTVSLDEAKSYPTLRDKFIGRVEVRFEKNNISFSKMFKWNK